MGELVIHHRPEHAAISLETATYIDALVTSNPDGALDQRSTADDHLRLIKASLKRTFPAIAGEVSISHGEANLLRSLSVNVQAEFTRIRTNPSNDGTVAYAVFSKTATSASSAEVARTANSASYAVLASFANSASFAASASYAALAGQAVSASYAESAAYALTCTSASSAQLLAGQAASEFAAAAHAHAAGDITSGTLADGRVAQSNVTQHQAALTIGGGQVSGAVASATNATNATNASSASFATTCTSASGAAELGGAVAALYARKDTGYTMSATVHFAVNPVRVGAGAVMSMASGNNISGGAITITSTTPTVVFGSPGDIQLVCGPL